MIFFVRFSHMLAHQKRKAPQAWCFSFLRSHWDRPTLKICDFQDMGSHTPPEDRRARSQGSEAARRSKKTIDNRFPLSVTEPKREGWGYIRQRRNSRYTLNNIHSVNGQQNCKILLKSVALLLTIHFFELARLLQEMRFKLCWLLSESVV